MLAPVLSLPFQIVHASRGNWHLVAVHVGALVGAGFAYRELTRGRLQRAAWVLLASLGATVTYAAWHGGGLAGHASPFLCFVSMLAALTLDGGQRVAGIGAAVLAVLGLGLFGPTDQPVSDGTFRASVFILVATAGAIVVSLDGTMERLARDVASATQSAEEANARKDRLLARVSHYLRTPLNAIVGYTELLADDARGEERVEAVEDMERILRASHGLLSILDDILDVARVESGSLRSSHGRIDLDSLCGQLSATVNPLAATRNNRFELMTAPIPFEVWLDEGRLRQVLLNLLGNACKFTSDGEVCLRVGPGSDGMLRFEVEDTGVGMDADQCRRVREALERRSATVARTHGGTGLGLAICGRLVEEMGGQLRMTSEPGEGTRFWGELPAKKAS